VAESKLGRSEIGHPLPGDASQRGFYLTLGSGAGKRKYFYWLQHPNLAEATQALTQLEAALRDPPTLSSLTGVSDDALASLAMAAPALMQTMLGGTVPGGSTLRQGLTLAHFRAHLEDLRDTSLTLEPNFSTFGTHPRFIWVMQGTK
jgi:hypothetical protein